MKLLFDNPDQVISAYEAMKESCGSVRAPRMGGMKGTYFAQRCNLNVKGRKKDGCNSKVWEEKRGPRGDLLGWKCVVCGKPWSAEARQLKPGMIQEGSRKETAADRLADLATLDRILSRAAKLTKLERQIWRLVVVESLGEEYEYDSDGYRRHRYEAVMHYAKAKLNLSISKRGVYELTSSAREKTVCALKKQKPSMWMG